MTDDAMLPAIEIAVGISTSPQFSAVNSPLILAICEACTTALLEKLKSEGALNAAVTNLREMDNWLTKDAEGDTIENYEAIARAVIEALEKELV